MIYCLIPCLALDLTTDFLPMQPPCILLCTLLYIACFCSIQSIPPHA